VPKLAVIGDPIEHSLSPVMFNAAFQVLGWLDWTYEKIQVKPSELKSLLPKLKSEGYIGLNVTIPHKQAMLNFFEPDTPARAIGGINAVDLRTHTGTNTDWVGLIDDLRAHSIKLKGQRILIVGAGGAARAAIYGLYQTGAHISVFNRTPERLNAVIHDFPFITPETSLNSLQNYQVILNCTPVGMYPHADESPIPPPFRIPKSTVVYDLIYRPRQTKLMRLAAAQGCRVIGGFGMLIRQGAAAFEWWTGQPAPLEVMRMAVEKELA